jgi:hypothetical protein
VNLLKYYLEAGSWSADYADSTEDSEITADPPASPDRLAMAGRHTQTDPSEIVSPQLQFHGAGTDCRDRLSAPSKGASQCAHIGRYGDANNKK